MKKAYIAGSYSADNVLDILNNIRRGIRAGTEVLLAGYSPFIPWLDYNVFLQLREGEQISIEHIREHSMVWLEASDAVLVLPYYQTSSGTLMEINRAKELKIPVFYNLEDLKEKI